MNTQSSLRRSLVPASALLGLLGLTIPTTGCNSSSDSTPGPRVTVPAAGAILSGDVEIRWSNIGGGDMVAVDLSDDGGMTYANNIEAATENDGALMIDTTAFVDGTDYRIRVSTMTRDAESGIFTIDNTAPVLTLLTPNAGDFVGQAGLITWMTVDTTPGTVEILASSDSGANFDIIVAAAAPDSGSFNWDVTGLPETNNYRVQLTPIDLAGQMGASVASSGDFSLDLTAPTISLTSPNGGESLTGIVPVTWTTTEANPSTVEIRASVNSGTTFPTVVAAEAPDTGTFSWRTASIEDTTTGRVRVVATDLAGNESAADMSDADFGAENLRLINVAHYEDENGTGAIDAGDTLLLRFDKNIALDSTTNADFELPVAGDTLGAGASFAVGFDDDSLLITLGANPVLRTRSEFDVANVAAGAPSGINIAAGIAADSIETAVGGIDASPIAVAVDATTRPVDLTPLAAALTTARYGDAGDLDGDGDLDLVIAVTGGDPSLRFEGDGNNGWTEVQMFDADDTQDVALGDIDGDGDLDAVTATVGVNRVWTNDGSGALTDSAQSLGTAGSLGVSLGDLDGDGDLDAFFANGGASAMANRVYFNDGMGAFVDSGQSIGGGNSSAVALGDMDGDGDLDAFVANNGDSNSQLFMNNGAGVFSSFSSTLQTQAQDVQLGDFDGDGDLDVFIAVNGQNQIHENQGNGTFVSPFQLVGNNDNRGVALIDLDGDGDLDAVTAKNQDSGRFWINDGDGVFTIDTVDSEPDPAAGIIAGRFDGDGDVDFFIINDMGAHRPYRNSASGGQPNAQLTATALTAAAAGGQSGLVSVGDLDGDGDDDVIVPNMVGTTGVLLSNRDGSFTAGDTFGGADARGGDLFDADGDTDLDYLERSGDVGTITDRLWLNDGGVFTDSGLTLGLDTFAAGDLDGDGDSDLIVITATDIETWDGDGAGAFAASGQSIAATDIVHASVRDLTGDGRADLVVATTTTVDVYTNDGLGVFTMTDTEAVADVTALTLVDLDRDGLDDVLFAASEINTDLRWLENQGAGVFAAAASAVTVQNAFTQLVAIERDEDGNVDIMGVDQANELLFTLLGNGDGTLQPSAGTAAADLGSVAAIDVDKDGDTDVYSALGGGATPGNVPDEILVLD